jgi:hypothetical protein
MPDFLKRASRCILNVVMLSRPSEASVPKAKHSRLSRSFGSSGLQKLEMEFSLQPAGMTEKATSKVWKQQILYRKWLPSPSFLFHRLTHHLIEFIGRCGFIQLGQCPRFHHNIRRTGIIRQSNHHNFRPFGFDLPGGHHPV